MRARLLPLIAISPLSALLLSCQQAVPWPAIKQAIRAEFPDVEQISTAELNTWLTSEQPPPLLLDVREVAEYQVSHLRDAIRVDPGGETLLPADTDKNSPIITYCSVGYRSSRVAKRLMEQGYTNVSNLEGSIFEWANQGLPVVREGEEVRKVHPYDRNWERLLDSELRAYSVD